MNSTGLLTATALAAALTVSVAYAQQQQQGQRVSGTIEKVDGTTIYGKANDGSAITVKLADNVAVTAVYKATLADIKPGAYIGSGAIPQPDGSQKAVEVHIFQKPQADGGHHYSGWFGAPSGTMTNGFVEPTGTVGAAFTGGGGAEPSFLVKYHDGEKRVIVPANAHIVRNEAGSKDDLKVGAAFRVQAAAKQADGSYTASAISVGRDGGRPF
jgi:hypothetical protein